MNKYKKNLPWFILSAFCFAAAAFFAFALIGYRIIALLLAGVGVLILLYLHLPKKLRRILTVLIVLGALILCAAEIPIITAAKGTPEFAADYLIVLGCGINGSTPSLSMLNRLSAALDYLNTHPACIAVVSGGQGPGENMTEAACMANWLTANGIAPERIIEESRSTSTEENLTFSLALIPNADNARIAVCSSEYHLYRAGRIAQRLGVSVGGVPGRTNLPVLRLNYFIREGLGVLYYSVFGGL